MADETLRSNLAKAFEPGPDFPSRGLLSRTMAMLEVQVDRSPRSRGRLRLGLPRAAPQFVAGVLLVCLALAAVAIFVATHRVPVPTPVHTPPLQITSPGAIGCSTSCRVRPLVFVSAKVGWLIENRGQDAGACSPSCPTGSVILSTRDGGLHWTSQLSSNSWSQEILASPDGMELMVVPSPGLGATLHHSTDGGVHWTSSDLPTQKTVSDQLYFFNPHEGWLSSLEPTSSVVDVFHTIDSGAHWNLIRIDTKAKFGLDFEVFTDLLQTLFFTDSATGWFQPAPSWSAYVTHDGGATWRMQSIPRPNGVQADWTAWVDQIYLFPNGMDGVLSMHVRHPGLIGPAGPQSAPYRYVYTTSDSGDHWSNPTYPPAVDVPGAAPSGPSFVDVNIAFIDATHWVGWPQPTPIGAEPIASFMHTSDAGRHWDVLTASSLQTVQSFDFLDPLRGWVVGAQGSVSYGTGIAAQTGLSLYVTTDGGSSWTPLKVPGLS